MLAPYERGLEGAGRSAWNDRGVGIAEVRGSNPRPSTKKRLIFNIICLRHKLYKYNSLNDK